MALPAGTRLGPYEIAGPLGAGGMGEVYRAHDTRLERDVAIKVLPASFAGDSDRVRRFEQEARAVGRLNHPNILSIHDVGTVPEGLPGAGGPFLVTELLEGQTLQAEIGARPLPVRNALEFAKQIAEGLAAAHNRGIVHRDLKPANLFITRVGHLKILDFGLAKFRDAPSADETATAAFDGTGSGVVLGTTSYMAPEQIRAQPVDHRTDIFAFGAVLYEMLTGRRAFQGPTVADTMSAILNVEPAPMSGPPPNATVSPALERTVRRCLEKSPDRRFQSARDLAFSFEEQSGAEGSSSRTRARRAWPYLAATATIVAAAIAWWFWSSGATKRPPVPAAVTGPAVVSPFLASATVETRPAWSPNGNFIAYVSEAAGNQDIWMSDLSGANPINLTKDHPADDSFPAWSPDGQRIAFYSEREGGGIFSMTPLGSDVRKLVSVPPSVEYTFSLQWARNGSLVYTNFTTNGDKQVFRTTLEQTTPECLTCRKGSEAGARSGNLSPSGRWLAYVGSQTGPVVPLSMLDLTTGRVHVVFDKADEPQWQSDDRLLFISARDGLRDIWELDIDPESGQSRGEPRRITAGLDAAHFAIGLDGRQLLGVKEKATTNIWTFPTTADRVDDLASGIALTTGEFRDVRPRWSPDGKDVYFASNRRGSVDIWKVPSSGGQPARLTTLSSMEDRPRPSPDGKWVAFDLDGFWTWLMRPDGGGAHELMDWNSRYLHACCGSWSPDGSTLALTLSVRDGTWRIGTGRVDPSSGLLADVREIDAPGAAEEYPRWSPDGRSLLLESFNDASWNLWTMDPDGSHSRQLTALPGNERFGGWQPKPLRVYFRKDEREVWRISMASASQTAGPPQSWLVLKGFRIAPDSLDISPDSTRLVVGLVKPESDIWLVERK